MPWALPVSPEARNYLSNNIRSVNSYPAVSERRGRARVAWVPVRKATYASINVLNSPLSGSAI